MNHHVPLLPAASRLAAPAPALDSPMAKLDADMRFVLETHARMRSVPLELTSPRLARRQPDLEAAMGRILERSTARPSRDTVSCERISVPGAGGDLRALFVRPNNTASGPLPIIVWLHDGLFVSSDATPSETVPRMLAQRCGAIVVAPGYRQAPEHPFPAAHEDALAVWKWLMHAAAPLGGDKHLVALAGEGSGANLALNVALDGAKATGVSPKHLMMVSPVAQAVHEPDAPTGSWREARPLGTATVRWALRQLLQDVKDSEDPRINLVGRKDYKTLPETTLLLAEIDPLLGEGKALAAAIARSGASIETSIYDGVSHGFFALAAVVNKAMFAQAQATSRLNRSFRERRQSLPLKA
ncbi:hypothetical protein GCM10007989_18240 [Devosia pacifica]|uniref:Alpha/beta hydrolase fold-3 domain-containing protein n=1 Tax=Devosia pacifica TaxID=1335967 RepID=A0A918VU38_9HYPH|nr:alpha/beta hydrolase [Devosia pacifica]GHA23116.1 hypothetical protein GCM10007989_18240 [Devosia pacifica]